MCASPHSFFFLALSLPPVCFPVLNSIMCRMRVSFEVYGNVAKMVSRVCGCPHEHAGMRCLHPMIAQQHGDPIEGSRILRKSRILIVPTAKGAPRSSSSLSSRRLASPPGFPYRSCNSSPSSRTQPPWRLHSPMDPRSSLDCCLECGRHGIGVKLKATRSL